MCVFRLIFTCHAVYQPYKIKIDVTKYELTNVCSWGDGGTVGTEDSQKYLGLKLYHGNIFCLLNDYVLYLCIVNRYILIFEKAFYYVLEDS